MKPKLTKLLLHTHQGMTGVGGKDLGEYLGGHSGII